jgi:hypothetical protein
MKYVQIVSVEKFAESVIIPYFHSVAISANHFEIIRQAGYSI